MVELKKNIFNKWVDQSVSCHFKNGKDYFYTKFRDGCILGLLVRVVDFSVRRKKPGFVLNHVCIICLNEKKNKMNNSVYSKNT